MSALHGCREGDTKPSDSKGENSPASERGPTEAEGDGEILRGLSGTFSSGVGAGSGLLPVVL